VIKIRQKPKIDKKWTKYMKSTEFHSMVNNELSEFPYLGIRQHSNTRDVTITIPPQHFIDEDSIKECIKQLILKHNYFCSIHIVYGLNSSDQFNKGEGE